MTDNSNNSGTIRGRKLSRRNIIKGSATLAGAALIGGVAGGYIPNALTRKALAQGERPIKVGFQAHRTGVGATYGRWYERTTKAAVKLINEMGGIAGRPIDLIIEDDGTDPKRGAEVVEKFALQHKVDLAFGTLFSHVVLGSAPRAGELKLPYFVVSEGTHVSSGKLSRYVFQPGISDVRAQMTAIAGWVLDKLGKNVTIVYPDYAFGYDHRDYFGAAVKAGGGNIAALIPIPFTESSFTRYFPRIPSDTELVYHVMVGPGVLTFVKEMGEHFGSRRPNFFGFIDSLEGADIASPGLEFLEDTYFWEALPRYSQPDDTRYQKYYRQAVGVTDEAKSVADSKDTPTYSHMFGCWETLFIIKRMIEQSGYREATAGDKANFIETLENAHWFNEGIEHPQGPKQFNGKTHQGFARQNISHVVDRRLKRVHQTAIADSLYESDVDYTKMAL